MSWEGWSSFFPPLFLLFFLPLFFFPPFFSPFFFSLFFLLFFFSPFFFLSSPPSFFFPFSLLRFPTRTNVEKQEGLPGRQVYICFCSSHPGLWSATFRTASPLTHVWFASACSHAALTNLCSPQLSLFVFLYNTDQGTWWAVFLLAGWSVSTFFFFLRNSPLCGYKSSERKYQNWEHFLRC